MAFRVIMLLDIILLDIQKSIVCAFKEKIANVRRRTKKICQVNTLLCESLGSGMIFYIHANHLVLTYLIQNTVNEQCCYDLI